MKITLTQFQTLDGVIQAPGGPDEDTSDGFEHGGWSVPYGDEDFGAFVTEVFGRVDAFLLGRRTYEIFAGYWPKMTDPADPIASRLNALPKYVASRTLTRADWTGTEIIGRDDLVKDVTALKERPGRELQLHGSAGLAQSLLAHDLIDTLHLLTFPVALGTGRRLFAEGGLPTAFRHTGSRTTSKGVAINSYDREGRPEYGSY
ncbi:dihydrofolate reductase family protein [Streptomyces spectabilis]|uniref:Dihydrofolate reductase n=1 Tax=Streptomyces spectabilis TaxID=68270 RepID=A0A5P2XGW0_STRST|nr:dihydrofolate reductase family protein [Streptomyces spectabilis]MBB5109283.1 dihydrofolate reductase [Streptomyces spectabilis]MCI3905979.1 dihydrofolate reductase family protein [Streptomyces spectabilis]QEV62884.1 dihydrofolate reductase [Streptomyces spectabilis]GGV05567.1 deaminase reductase [Streptomyces spectabilis]